MSCEIGYAPLQKRSRRTESVRLQSGLIFILYIRVHMDYIGPYGLD